MSKDVFVSYSSKDRPTADTIRDALERAGLWCWMAPRDVQPGVDYAESIIEGINGARVMVLVFSVSANASPQIAREVERAVHKGLPIIPVRIEDVFPSRSLEYFLSSPHWLDAIGPITGHLSLLTDAVRAMLARVAEGTLIRPPAAPRRLFTRNAVPAPVQVQDTVPISGLVPAPRVFVDAPPLPPPRAGWPAGFLALGAGLLVIAVAAVVARRSSAPAERAAQPPPAATRPAHGSARSGSVELRPAAPAPVTVPAAETPPASQRVYECREGVKFTVSPDTASVSINGRRVGTAAEWSDRRDGRVYTFARPGTYQVKLTQKGFAPAYVRISVRGSASRDVAEVKLDLRRAD